MKRKKLGSSNISVAPIAFGGNVFGWTVDPAMGFKILDRFVEKGFNLIDTADIYSAWAPNGKGGESETLIGQWLKKSGQRSQVIIATKVGSQMPGGGQGLSRKHILSSVEKSLQRLQTDHIDLYQSHRDDPDTPIEETLEAYDELIKAGKVRIIGASNFTADRLKESLKIAKDRHLPAYQTLQPLYNLYDREDFETDLEKVCMENHLGVISYYSLASGFLTGKYRSEADLSKSVRGGGVKKYFTPRGEKILAALDKVASELERTPAQIALAWLLTRPSVTAPIVSATNLQQLDDILEAATLSLSKEAKTFLDDASQV